jgi:predicted patatin/cPLA2 family phospholipase
MIQRPPLRELLIDRARSGSRRGKRKDPYHIALVVECGGMRCAAAAGVIQALTDANCVDAFDTLHGSSAGACAAAYFLTGQSEEGRKIYFEDICHRRVVSPYRLWSYPSMVDTDFIGDIIVGKRRVIDIGRIAAEPGVLNVVTSNVMSGLPTVHSDFRELADIIAALKATLRVPGLRECGFKIAGERHLDGGISAPIPVFSAIRSRATHILVVGTQRADDYHRKNQYVEIERALLRSLYGRPLADAYRAANAVSAIELQHQTLRGVECVIVARPAGSTFCAWHTIDTSILHAVEQEGRLAMQAFISGSSEAISMAAKG